MRRQCGCSGVGAVRFCSGTERAAVIAAVERAALALPLAFAKRIREMSETCC